MFANFSERARRIIFLSRKIAGQRGAGAIGVEDLIEAFVLEDQGRFAETFSESIGYRRGGVAPVVPQNRPFLGVETAAEILSRLAPLLQKNEPIPDSADMELSPALNRVLTNVPELAEELHPMELGPLHLLAAALSGEPCAASDAVRQAGITQEAVAAAIADGDSI
jgi:ATP-dependent Clp protease ATP-binding subunit ClpA